MTTRTHLFSENNKKLENWIKKHDILALHCNSDTFVNCTVMGKKVHPPY